MKEVRCEQTNLVLNWEKFHFMVNEGIVLGHKIFERGIEVEKAKVDAIEKMPCPKDIKGKLLSKWEGPYVIKEVYRSGAIKINNAEGMSVSISFRDVFLRIVSIRAIKSTHLSFSRTAQNEMAIPRCRRLTTRLPVQGRAKTSTS
ncbi:uncharacterized protein [Aegilops tauschii subsp. strangulata]|uniref:uncharacterized protein isoform X2 n=2 Tax=Aegilops tauschii subsp. strangulata TaxID=200361 RepID=UPI003CC84F46